LGDIRLDESGFGFGDCISVNTYTISYHVNIYKVVITGSREVV